MIFEYEAVTNRKPEYSEIVSALETAVQTARQYFLHCDNAVVTHDDENAFLLEILYTIFNRSTCEVKTVEQRIRELQSARRDADITMPVSLKSVFAPDSIDLTHGSYVVMDGVYHAYLIVPSDGYNPRVVAGWTSILVNAGEGIDVDFYFSREPKERIQAKLGQQIRINRSRLKDTSDTNSDFDDFESAIRSGYFLKEGLANYEDFYYCNTLVTITADTLENLEWRISEVRRLMVSQDMDIRICRFRQEQALLSILPLCSLNKKLFEASKRNMLTSAAARRTFLFSWAKCFANLPIVVVLPAPLTPHIMMTSGLCSSKFRDASHGLRISAMISLRATFTSSCVLSPFSLILSLSRSRIRALVSTPMSAEIIWNSKSSKNASSTTPPVKIPTKLTCVFLKPCFNRANQPVFSFVSLIGVRFE